MGEEFKDGALPTSPGPAVTPPGAFGRIHGELCSFHHPSCSNGYRVLDSVHDGAIIDPFVLIVYPHWIAGG